MEYKNSEYRKRYYQKHKEKIIERSKKYNQEHKEEIKKYLKGNEKDRTNYYLMRNYGITLDDYNRMFEEQHGACKICGKVCENGKVLHIDHNHKTKKVRGLICMNCNRMLGNAHDNPKILLMAIEYLTNNIKK